MLFAKRKNIAIEKLKDIIHKSKKILLNERGKRIRPITDDKILLGWNALMNTAISKAFACTGNEEYRKLAIRNMDFLYYNFSKKDSPAFYQISR